MVSRVSQWAIQPLPCFPGAPQAVLRQCAAHARPHMQGALRRCVAGTAAVVRRTGIGPKPWMRAVLQRYRAPLMIVRAVAFPKNFVFSALISECRNEFLAPSTQSRRDVSNLGEVTVGIFRAASNSSGITHPASRAVSAVKSAMHSGTNLPPRSLSLSPGFS